MSFKIILFLITISISLHANENRIVSLHPTLTEILFELNLQDSIVGTVEYSDYPEAAKLIPKVGDYKVNIEKVLALRPTHILGEHYQISSLKDGSLKQRAQFLSFIIKTRSDYEPTLTKLGKAFSKEKKALELIKKFNSSIELLNNKQKEIMAILLIEQRPLTVAGNNNFLNDALLLCGYKNSFSSLDFYKKINSEELISKNKHLLVVVNDKDNSKEIAKRFGFKKYIYYQPSVITRLTLRWPTEVKNFCNTLKQHEF